MTQNEQMPKCPYWNVKQAASFLGISSDHLYKLVRAGKVPHSRPFSGTIYFEESELRAFIEDGRIEPTAITNESIRENWLKNMK